MLKGSSDRIASRAGGDQNHSPASETIQDLPEGSRSKRGGQSETGDKANRGARDRKGQHSGWWCTIRLARRGRSRRASSRDGVRECLEHDGPDRAASSLNEDGQHACDHRWLQIPGTNCHQYRLMLAPEARVMPRTSEDTCSQPAYLKSPSNSPPNRLPSPAR